jgi:hypothetical protein
MVETNKIKKFLEEEEVYVELVLIKDLDNENAEKIIIRRNFLIRTKYFIELGVNSIVPEQTITVETNTSTGINSGTPEQSLDRPENLSHPLLIYIYDKSFCRVRNVTCFRYIRCNAF